MPIDPLKESARRSLRDDRPLALIAGAGNLPIEAAVAISSRAKPRPLVALGFPGITSPDLEALVSSMHWLELGQLSALAAALRESKADRVLLLGKVSKSLLLSGEVGFSPDDEARSLLARHRDRSDDGLLALIACWLEEQGFELLDQGVALRSMLASAGPMTRLEPSEQARADFSCGWPIVTALGSCGAGQCVVMKEGAVLAVEALEGTDETIRRAGRLGGPGATVIKALRMDQDRRLDLPAVGPDTIRVMLEAGATALAIEAGAALILDRERCLAEADAGGIAVWGFDAGRESP